VIWEAVRDQGSAETYIYMQSLYYRSPEVTLGKLITFAIDVWSVGVMMYGMLFGNNVSKQFEFGPLDTFKMRNEKVKKWIQKYVGRSNEIAM
jgi:serine/threonine protein kinase